MGSDLNQKLLSFSPISLSQLNAQASFLDRVDVKYLMSEEDFENILKDLEKNFYLLEINGKSIFEYSSIYMDSENYDFYYQHQNGIKPRTKIRTRLYVDSNLAFFEYKQKDKNVTRKFRYQFAQASDHGKMTQEWTKFFEETYKSLYGETPKTIFPALETRYNRLTFCSKDSAERLTIDFHINLTDIRNPKKETKNLRNLVIVESKSSKADGMSHKIMKKYGIEKAHSCSKYGLGLAYNETVKEYSVFSNTMKKVDEIGER